MRLLIVTQAVDREDPVLGFFHRWISEFSKHAEGIDVICLREGTHDLPSTVRVHSLGKESGGGRVRYALRFLSLVFRLRRDTDSVFVHMNSEYVVLAGWFWKLTGKRVGLWYNHEVASVWFRVAAQLCDLVFHTSPYAASATVRRAHRMPAGIDTGLFRAHDVPAAPHSVYFQGRVAPAKKVHVLLGAIRLLRDAGIPATVTIAGPEDQAYAERLRSEFSQLFASEAAVFLGGKKNEETPALFSAHAVSVNLTAAGNYDKTVLESCACEVPVIVGSPAFAGIVPSRWELNEVDASSLAETLKQAFALSADERAFLGRELRAAVEREHGLTRLGGALAAAFEDARIL